MEDYYLLGFIRSKAQGDHWDANAIAYRSSDGHIAIAERPIPHSQGSVYSAAHWLAHRPGRIIVIDDKPVVEREQAGWFARVCAEADCEWFIRFAHRLASGERIPLCEILSAYSAANSGRTMISGSLSELFQWLPSPQPPNKAPEPTTTSVMPAAEQPSRRP